MTFLEWYNQHIYFTWNSISVFLLAGIYSYVELLQISSKPKQIWKIGWGYIYIFGNSLVSLLALYFTFWTELNQHYLWGKLLIAGTSGLALLRVLSVNLKEKGVEDKSYTIIQILQKRVFAEFDRKRSQIDLPRLRKIMAPFDNHLVIIENLPLLFQNLMRTLSSEDQQLMTSECEKFRKIKDGNEKIKCINLGAVMARYVGMDLLESTITELKDFLVLPPSGDTGQDSIDDYIKKFS